MKTILGLDLGTNSIGWALVRQNFDEKRGEILGMGSRIIPMPQDIKDEFGKGNSISRTADRTKFRSVRRLRERHLLRRERLHRVLNVLGFLPDHYASQIDFERRFGKFKDKAEPKLAYNGRDFIFKGAFEEMLADFRLSQSDLLTRKNRNGQDLKVPYDWTLYYLRKKALTKKIEKEELAWLLLHFNQKRGYHQLRGEEEDENPNKRIEFCSLKIVDVVPDDEPNKKGEIWYSLHLENGWIYRRSSKTPLTNWKDKIREFIVTTDLEKDGSVKKDKEGLEKRSFRAPDENDWTLIKKKTEFEIAQSGKTVGGYVYDNLVENPAVKIKGKLVRTVERKFYKDELRIILSTQSRFHPELQDSNLYNDCIKELYRNNEVHRQALSQRDFTHLFLDDIIFYQRPLRSQKSSIGNCSLEFRKFKAKDKGGDEIERVEYLKAIPKSHPLYQEFRLWQWILNLKIYAKENDMDVTSQFIHSIEQVEQLFEFLNECREIKQEQLIKFFLERTGLKAKALNVECSKYRWNYVEDKSYPCNETGTLIRNQLSKVEGLPGNFLTREVELKLWHIIYSVTDKTEFEKALKSFALRHSLDETIFFENFRKTPPFESAYGAFSEKAIKKLLPLMRVGKYWSWESIDVRTKNRIEKILSAEYDQEIKDRVREKAIHLESEDRFQGLPLWLAQYIVYDRHSEAGIVGKWNSVDQLEKYLTGFRQHSLRNPIVEQIVTESLRVVKDIWLQYGMGAKDFFDEIHVELGREMKRTKNERESDSRRNTENENTNQRIKALLVELANDSSIDNVRPYSPMQQEALKIYEDYAINSDQKYNDKTGSFEHDPVNDDILKISKTAQPSKSDLIRYKLWLEQRYRSPYTGQMIPLGKLFTHEYQIEHIIPQSRYFDDSFTNKVICESSVNSLKNKQLGLEFIRNNGGQIINDGSRQYKILSEAEYLEMVRDTYSKSRLKMNKLLLDEIPDRMIERQLNDTRYISTFISNLLSNIVREDKGDDGHNSKNLLATNGNITAKLRQDWGLNDVWNELILPRFERMNQLTNSTVFTAWSETHQKFLPTVPLELSKGFQKKRIDHRHHALDALVVACTTRDHINLLNNQSAKSEQKRYDLQHKLRNKEKWIDNEGKERSAFKGFMKPWNNFTKEAKDELEEIVVSFKQNLRVINRTTNKYEKYIEKNGEKVKALVSQTSGDSWAIRKPLHKDTVSGKLLLNRVKVPKGKVLTATRKNLNSSFNLKMIESITDTGIQKILINYLMQDKFKVMNGKGEFSYDSELAFSPEGLDDMNKNIVRYNDGKSHQPIVKVRVYEVGSKFPLGQNGNKKSKFVEAAKGTNLFFAIYADENGKRAYSTIPLNEVIERQKLGLYPVPENDADSKKIKFFLSPNDLVYVPTKEQLENFTDVTVDEMNLRRVYRFTDSSDTTANFVPASVSSLIFNYKKKEQDREGVDYLIQNEFGVGSPQSKNQKSIDEIMIKEVCIKIKVDRLGNISKE